MSELPRRGYYLIPDDQMPRLDLSPAHKLVMAVLARLQGDSASCFPSLEYIGRAVGLSRRQVKRIISDLKRRKEIIVVPHTEATNTYSVPWATARALRKKWAIERDNSRRTA